MVMNHSLSPAARFIWLVLWLRDIAKINHCDRGQLMADIGLSINTMRRHLNTLISNGLVSDDDGFLHANTPNSLPKVIQRTPAKFRTKTSQRNLPKVIRKAPKSRVLVQKTRIDDQKSDFERTHTVCLTPFEERKRKKECMRKSKSDTPKSKNNHGVLKWKIMAEKLVATIQITDNLRYHNQIPKWELAFRNLHEKNGADPKLIWEVLCWYCSQRVAKTDHGLPKCFTAAMFCGAWGWILERYRQSDDSIKISADSIWLSIAKKFVIQSELPITPESLAQLFLTIHEWHTSVWASLDGDDDGRFGMLRGVLDPHPEGTSFPEQVGHYLEGQVSRWDGWHGDLGGFTPGGKYFLNFIQARAKEVLGQRLGASDLQALGLVAE